MTAILFEGLVFLAAMALMLALGFYLVYRWTPIGTRIRQIRNRRAIEQRELTRCAIHGPQPESSLVRLKSGVAICSLCFKEAVEDVERQ